MKNSTAANVRAVYLRSVGELLSSNCFCYFWNPNCFWIVFIKHHVCAPSAENNKFCMNFPFRWGPKKETANSDDYTELRILVNEKVFVLLVPGFELFTESLLCNTSLNFYGFLCVGKCEILLAFFFFLVYLFDIFILFCSWYGKVSFKTFVLKIIFFSHSIKQFGETFQDPHAVDTQ